MGTMPFERGRGHDRLRHRPPDRQLRAERLEDQPRRKIRGRLDRVQRELRALAQASRVTLVGAVDRQRVEPRDARRVQRREARRLVVGDDLDDRGRGRRGGFTGARHRTDLERAGARAGMHETVPGRGSLERVAREGRV
jgi:hypothetical protein